MTGVKLAYALILSLGPILYLVGSAIYKKIVYGRVPVSHLAGVVILAALIALLLNTHLLIAGWLIPMLSAAWVTLQGCSKTSK